MGRSSIVIPSGNETRSFQVNRYNIANDKFSTIDVIEEGRLVVTFRSDALNNLTIVSNAAGVSEDICQQLAETIKFYYF
jgi:hypothetical protein